jgi:electron transfer flavoprotein beta subunit
MKILVLLKRVPDTASTIAVAADRPAIDPSGISWVVSPYDEIAVEKAIQLKEAGVAEKVTVVTLGPKEATKEIRTALAMGADEGHLLVDSAASRDAASTAASLAAAIGGMEYDLILAGWKAVDTDDSSVPHLLAGALDVPCATFAVGLEIEDGKAVVQREVEGAEEVLEITLPAVVTVQKGLCEPRYTSLKGIMMAKKKPLAEAEAGDAAPRVQTVSMELPPARPEGRVLGEGVDAVPELIRVLSEEQKLF